MSARRDGQVVACTVGLLLLVANVAAWGAWTVRRGATRVQAFSLERQRAVQVARAALAEVAQELLEEGNDPGVGAENALAWFRAVRPPVGAAADRPAGRLAHQRAAGESRALALAERLRLDDVQAAVLVRAPAGGAGIVEVSVIVTDERRVAHRIVERRPYLLVPAGGPDVEGGWPLRFDLLTATLGGADETLE